MTDVNTCMNLEEGKQIAEAVIHKAIPIMQKYGYPATVNDLCNHYYAFRQKYLKMSRHLHPDKGGDAKEFQIISELNTFVNDYVHNTCHRDCCVAFVRNYCLNKEEVEEALNMVSKPKQKRKQKKTCTKNNKKQKPHQTSAKPFPKTSEKTTHELRKDNLTSKENKMISDAILCIERIHYKNHNYTEDQIKNDKEFNQFPHLKDKNIRWDPSAIVTIKNFERVQLPNKQFYETLADIENLTLKECLILIVCNAEQWMPMPTQKYSGYRWFMNMLGAIGQNKASRRLWW